jgi:hypothetical protein
MRTTSLRAVAAVAALIVVAGCGGGSDSDGPAAEKTTASATPTPAATTPPAEQRPEDDRSDAGAIAFSAFMINRITGVLGGGNIDDVLTLATADCEGCVSLAQGVKKNGTVVQKFDGSLRISDAKVIDTSDDKTQYLVEQKVALPAGKKIDTATGKTVEKLDETQFTFRVLAVWKGDKWFIGNYSAKKAS